MNNFTVKFDDIPERMARSTRLDKLVTFFNAEKRKVSAPGMQRLAKVNLLQINEML